MSFFKEIYCKNCSKIKIVGSPKQAMGDERQPKTVCKTKLVGRDRKEDQKSPETNVWKN